jgi:hypothetical protein
MHRPDRQAGRKVRRETMSRLTIALTIAATVGMIALGLLTWWAASETWHALAAARPGDLATMLMLVSILLPIIGAAGYVLGRYESRATLAGLQEGVKSVMSAASGVADIRDRSAAFTAKAGKAARPDFNVIVPGQGHAFLPPISHRGSGEGDEVIDL